MVIFRLFFYDNIEIRKGFIMFQDFAKNATCELEKELFGNVFNNTPDYVKKLNLIDLSNKDEFVFVLKKEHLYPYDEKSNPEGLNLKDWFDGYSKEAKVSTAGIRGPQNILYPLDTRFPINLVGIVLATLAKALVLKEKFPNEPVAKIAGREVRYNSALYLDAIARVQAAQGIKTILPRAKQSIPIWLASFLTYKLGLYGGEYITSSHGISVKNATKDLNAQGGQYLPEESMEFVAKIEEIFEEIEKFGEYKITISAAEHPLVDESLMHMLNDGVGLYCQYLISGVAKESNLDLIKAMKNKLIVENVGGSAYRTLNRVLDFLNIQNKFDWFNIEEDPFFHSIGKSSTDFKGNKCFYDYSVDAGVCYKTNEGDEKLFPVISSMHYDEKLKKYPVGTVVLITDPDHDRLTVTQLESADKIDFLSKNGIDYLRLGKDRILSIFTANQAFLLLMDFWAKQLKAQGIWDNHPRFMIKTTASALSWDEWAENNGVKVVNVPVGFKEIANIMKKVELNLRTKPDKEIVIEDVFGNPINLGVNPRLIFAGEESGGMIMGSEDLVCSDSGCIAIAMREKSATEAIIVASALAAQLENEGKTLSQNLAEVFELNKINGRFDCREDISYYNESESDIQKLKENKAIGEIKRTQNDLFYLSLAMGLKFNKLRLSDIKAIFSDAFARLDFSDLLDLKFVGDGTYMLFETKFVEIRPSGTDAKTKAYAAGLDKAELECFTKTLGQYSGERTALHRKFIDDEFYAKTKDFAMDFYLRFVEKGSK